MSYELMFLRALAFTVAVETAVLFAARPVFLRREPGGSPLRLVAAGSLCSAATLPYLWFVLPAWLRDRHALGVIVIRRTRVQPFTRHQIALL
jgi:hypothetical protein